VEVVFAFALLLAGIVLITVAVTGSTFRQTVRGKANTARLHQTPGA